MEDVNYNPSTAAAPAADAANTALLAGKTYAEVSDLSLRLLTFAADGTFGEVFQRSLGGGTRIGENDGRWIIDGEAIVRIALSRDDVGEHGTALIATGLGGEEMSIETLNEVEGSRAINLIQVEAFEANEVLGSWFELGADGLATTSLTFDRDGGGAYEDPSGGGHFDWHLDGDGHLSVSPRASRDGLETITFHKLANSEVEMLSVVVVLRRNGELDYEVDLRSTPRNPIETFMLFRAF